MAALFFDSLEMIALTSWRKMLEFPYLVSAMCMYLSGAKIRRTVQKNCQELLEYSQKCQNISKKPFKYVLNCLKTASKAI